MYVCMSVCSRISEFTCLNHHIFVACCLPLLNDVVVVVVVVVVVQSFHCRGKLISAPQPKLLKTFPAVHCDTLVNY